MAEGLQDQSGVYVINDFFGGLNTYAPPNKIGENFLVEAQNVRINEVGLLTRRPGITQLGTIASHQAGDLYMELLTAGTDDKRRTFLVRGRPASGVLSEITMFGYRGSWDTVTVSLPTLSRNGKYSTSSWYIDSSGNQKLQTHFPAQPSVSSSTTVRTTIGSTSLSAALTGNTNTDPPVNSPTITASVDRLWAPGSGRYSHQLFFSSTSANKEAWNRTTEFVSFVGPHGTEIVAVSPYRENILLVGTVNEVYLLAVGTSIHLDSQVLLLSKDLGMASPKAVVGIGSDTIFVDGNGDVRAVEIERSNAGLIRKLPLSVGIKDKTELVDPADLEGVQLSYVSGMVYLLLPRSSGNEIYAYDIQNRNWVGPYKFSVQGGLSNSQKDGNPLLLSGTTSLYRTFSLSSRTRTMFFALDDGEDDLESVQVYSLQGDGTATKDVGTYPIEMVATTKAIDFGSPDAYKVLKWVRLQHVGKEGASGSYSIEVRVDFGQWIMIDPSVVYLSPKPVHEVHIPVSDVPRGKLFQFRIKCSDPNTTPEIIRVLVKVTTVQSRSF